MTSKKQLILLIALSIVCVIATLGFATGMPAQKTNSVAVSTTTTVGTTTMTIPTSTTTTTTIATTVPTTTITSVSGDYQVAEYIWKYLKGLGYNDYVAAGIMGNIMTESGGQSLKDIQWNVEDPKGNHYGICQWSAKYYPAVQGKDLDFQLDYLRDTVEYQFNTYGRLYQSGMKYEQFTQMEGDCGEAALAFAKVYERCNSKHYAVRVKNAAKAYEYFTN